MALQERAAGEERELSKNRDLLTADSPQALLLQKQPWGEVLIREEMSARRKMGWEEWIEAGKRDGNG